MIRDNKAQSPAEQFAIQANGAALPREEAKYKIRTPYKDNRLRELRKSLGLTLEQAAAGCETGLGQLAGWEKGREPMLSTALKLARFYGKTVEEIWI